MLAPRPPQSVARRREVAAMVVAYKQAAMIAPGHVVEGRVAPPPTRDVLPPSGPAITLRVVYRLGEYLAMLREYLPRGMLAWEQARGKATNGRLSWSTRFTLAVMVPLAGTPVFLLKKRRMPVCRFKIDMQGIERRAGGRRLSVPWSDVREVHRLRGAWLVDMGKGAMPLPYRCFDPAQRAAFERLLLSCFGDDTPV
jgi:hypothetical protein